MWKFALTLGIAGALTACGPITPSPNPNDTGGAGITLHEDHPARIHSAANTGSSSADFGAGTVLGTGATGETDNAHSPSESNGGQPLGMTNASGPMPETPSAGPASPPNTQAAEPGAQAPHPNGAAK